MKPTSLTLSLAAAILLTSIPAAADLTLPPPSPSATVKQQVGVTDVTVEYSSPAVKKRKIWGDLVPYEKPWRTGANAATKITFSRDVTFGGKPVPAGSYTIVTHPTAKGWQVSLSKTVGLWQNGKTYDAKDDVVRVAATTSTIPSRERMTFLFSNTTDSDASLDLEWEKLRVSVPITVETAKYAQESITTTLANAWRPHANAARYAADLKDYATALKYVETSMVIESNWYNNWVKADILGRSGKYADARKHAEESMKLGEKDPNFFFKDAVAKALIDWKDKK